MRKFEKLYLHVGLEKTGTTSIQKAMDAHRGSLEELGYYYPKQFAIGRNTLLAAMFLIDPMARENFRMVIEKRGGTQASHVAAMMKELDTELAGTLAENLILSSEFLASQSDLERLKTFAQSVANETEIIIYIREQCSLVLSLRSTYLKGGGTNHNFLDNIAKDTLPYSLNFEGVLGNLEKAFPGKIKVRLFDKRDLHAGDAVQDFFKTIGLGEQAGEFAMPRENESLSLVGAEFLKWANLSVPAARDGVRNVARDRMIRDIGVLDSIAPIFGKDALTVQQAEKIQNVYEAGNEWVREKYFPKHKSLFPPYKMGEKRAASKDDVLDYTIRLLEKAYGDMHQKQVLLNHIAPVLDELSKNENVKGEAAKELRELNRKILKDRKL